jgi:hypothetical protein
MPEKPAETRRFIGIRSVSFTAVAQGCIVELVVFNQCALRNKIPHNVTFSLPIMANTGKNVAHLYEVKHSNGQTYNVTTDKHHDNHHESDFKDHLVKIIERTVSGVAIGYVLHFTLKRHG